MSWLKIYEWEEQTYPEFQKIEIARSDVQKYLNKFTRHFKVQKIMVDMSAKGRDKESGSYRAGMIKVGHISTFGIVIHEFAHHLTREVFGKGHHHDKKFKGCLKKVYTFAKIYLPTYEKTQI